MDGLHICLVVLLGVVSHSHGRISGPVLEVTVRPGDNITLHCDCKISTGVYTVWYRSCSHENQPTLVLKIIRDPWTRNFNEAAVWNLPPRFHFVRNTSSESYDLLIMNITESDLGFYYCGTEEKTVENEKFITSRYVNRYGNVTTRIIFNSGDSCPCHVVPVVPWMMVFAPAFTILSSFLSFVLVYHVCQKTDKEPQILQISPDNRRQTRQFQDEDACSTRVVFRVKDGQTQQ